MHDFEYLVPTKIIFGKLAEGKIGKEIAARGFKRVLIVYGSDRIFKNGLIERITDPLKNENIEYDFFGGVKPNPRLEKAREGVEKAISFGAELILAVGGGSVIDTAKGIAHGAANPGIDIWKFWTREEPLTKSLPVGAVLTIAAAGSETSDSAVLQNSVTHSKRGINTPFNRPAFAVMNPELTFSLPKYQIACGVTDIMMHTMERYFTLSENALTDAFAESLLKTVIKEGKKFYDNPNDYDAASEIMWAGSVSHNGLTGLGGVSDFATHALGQQLSAFYDIAHGASLSVMWQFWARYVYSEKVQRFAAYARNVWNINESDDERAALLGIDKTIEFFKALEMPVSMSEAPEIGIKGEKELEELSFGTTYERTRTIGNFKKLGYDDILNIFKSANI